MAVSEQTPYIEHTGNGATTSFALKFQCESKDHLIVLIDDIEPPIATWSLTGGNVVFTTAPAAGKKITLQRNTPFSRTVDYQSYNNSFRPPAVNKDFDWIWLKLQELGVADMLLKIYVDRLHLEQKDYTDNKDRLVKNIINDLRNYVNQQQGNLSGSINNLKTYVDQQDNNRNSYFENLIDQQGVSLLQLDNYYNHLMQQLAQIAVDKGWAASFIVDASGENQQEINDRFKSKLQGEFISVWDFFTKSEKQSYNFALIKGTAATYDSYRPVKEFFDYIAANGVGTAYCNGTFYTSKGILFGGALGSQTKQVVGDFHICAILGSTIHTLFHMQCGKDLTWLGAIHVQGLGGLIFSARTVRRGLVLGGEYQCAHTYINSVNADEGFSEYGVLIDNLTTASNIDAIRVTRCGSGRSNASNSWSDTTNFTVHSESVVSGGTQETVLSVTKLPLPDLQYNPILKIGNELYHVKNVDYVNSRLTIFPLLNRDNTETFARYIYGAGVATAGGDASVCRIGKINSTNCGVVYHSGALYPAVVGAITAEANTINVLLGGNTITQAHVGGVINSLYCEAAEYDIVRRSRAQMSMTIVTNYALNLDKLYNLSRWRVVATNTLDTASVGFDGIQIAYNGKWLTWENRAQGNNNITSIDVTDVNRSEYWHYGSTSKTFNIIAPNAAINNQFGYNRKSCVVVGANNAGAPTEDIVFNAPEGYTVNGSSSVTFNGFTQAAKFDVYLQFPRNNFVVVCLTLPPTSALSASVAYDPELLAPNEIKYWNVTLNGAKLGDAVVCSFSRALNGTRIWAEVTGANIVTVYHQNPTANPVDLTSGTLSVKLV